MKFLLATLILVFSGLASAQDCATEGSIVLVRQRFGTIADEGFGAALGVCQKSETSQQLQPVPLRGSELAVMYQDHQNNPTLVKAFKDITRLTSSNMINAALLDGNIIAAKDRTSDMTHLRTIAEEFNKSVAAAAQRPHLPLLDLASVGEANRQALIALQQGCTDNINKKAGLKPAELRFADGSSQGIIPLSFELKGNMTFVLVYADPSKPRTLQTRILRRLPNGVDELSEGAPHSPIYPLANYQPLLVVDPTNVSGLSNMSETPSRGQGRECWLAENSPRITRESINEAQGTLQVK